MARITSSWSKIKEVYCGNDGYHDIYWRMYARISAQSGMNTTVSVEGRLYVSGTVGSISSWTTTTAGGVVGNYSRWGVNAAGTYYVGETTLWSGSDTTTNTSINAGVRFYSSPWGWVGENLYISDTLVFEPAIIAPSGLAVSLSEVYTNGAKFHVSISSYGTPGNVDGRYIEAGICAQNSYGSTYKYNKAQNTTSSDITVNNDSTWGTLTIRPNTRYYYGGYATNTAPGGDAKMIQGQLVTKAEAPTVWLVSTTANSATIGFSVPADGGYYDRDIQYSLDNGTTWRSNVTVVGGYEVSDSFVIGGLLSGTTYTMLTRVSTDAGTTDGNTISFDTLVSEADNENRCYGSVNGLAREINAIYGGVEGTARRAIRLYGATADYDLLLGTIGSSPQAVVGFNADTFKAKLVADGPDIWANRYTLVNLIVTGVPNTPTRNYKLDFLFSNGSVVYFTGDASMLNSYGISVNEQIPADYRQTVDYISLSPQIIAKLIHQAFGHIDYS